MSKVFGQNTVSLFKQAAKYGWVPNPQGVADTIKDDNYPRIKYFSEEELNILRPSCIQDAVQVPGEERDLYVSDVMDIVGIQPPRYELDLRVLAQEQPLFSYEPLFKLNPGWERGAQGIGDCLVAGTHVLGPDGVKCIEDVKVGDRVYAGNGEITEVITTQTKKSFKQLLTIHTQGGIPLTVTGDHKVLVYRFKYAEKRVSGKHKRVSKNLYEREIASRNASKASSKWQLSRPNAIVDQWESREAVLTEAKDLRTSDYLLCPVETKFDSSVPEEFQELMSDPETRWLVGLFLGDGYAGGNRIEFACTVDEPEILDRLTGIVSGLILALGGELEVKPHHTSKKGQIVLWKQCPIEKLFRKAFYDSNKQKVLPSWAICDDVIAGLRDADGHQSKDGNIQYFDSTSPSLAHGVRLWAINAGYCPSMKEVVRSEGSYDNAKPLYRVRWQLDRSRERLWRDDNYLALPITKIEAQEGPNTVYDIGVKHELHTFYANGVVSSNCVSWGWELSAYLSHCIDIIIEGQPLLYQGEFATESIYGGARVEALNKTFGGWSDGAWGGGAARWATKGTGGFLLRKDYSKETGNPEHDLRQYSAKRAKDWGAYGCGGRNDKGALDKVAKMFPGSEVRLVRTWDEYVLSIMNGAAIAICSMIGLSPRGANGFSSIQGTWAHCMMGSSLRFDTLGSLITNSWGNSWGTRNPFFPASAPLAIQKCSTWVTKQTIIRMLAMGDTFAVFGVDGIKRRPLVWSKVGGAGRQRGSQLLLAA